MQRFRNILFVSDGLTDSPEFLVQALNIARTNKAELNALIVCPAFPDELENYREKYEASLVQHVNASLQAARANTGVDEAQCPVRIEVESGGAPSQRTIRHVLQHAHDLLMKEAEPKEGEPGFKAMDMELLRKCPCPLWLSRPIGKECNEAAVAVAIDPQNEEPEGQDLSLRLLQLSRSLADACSGELNIISCWDYPFEDYLRSPSGRMPDDELFAAVSQARMRHHAALKRTIRKSGIGGDIQVLDVRGRPDQMIPQLAAGKNIDILVMGTVARMGIPGFIIGNTAENVVQKLECSLLALKPNGFVSPVKAY